MKRLFLLAAVGSFAAVLLGLVLAASAVRWRIEAVWDAAVRDCHEGGLRLMVDTLAAASPADRPGVLADLASRFPYPVIVKPIERLPAAARRQLASDAVAIYWVSPEPGHARHVAGRIPGTADALELGPFPDTVAPGVEAAINGWMQILADRVTSGDDRAATLAALQPSFPQRLVIADVPLDAPAHGGRPEVGRTRFVPSGPQGTAAVADPHRLRYYAETPLAGGGYLRLGPFAALDGDATATFVQFLATTVPLILASLAVVLWPLGRQLRDMERIAARLAEGDLNARFKGDPFGATKPLTEAFNVMAGRIEALLTAQRHTLQAVSHEVRTPLARIRFAVELAAAADSEAERAEKLAVAQTAIDDLDRLVEELLEYVRLETGTMSLNLDPVDANAVVTAAVSHAQQTFPGVVVEAALLGGAAPAILLVEERGFLRVITNLVGNAAKHARGRVLIAITAATDMLQIDVDDDGPGIPPEMRGIVLKPFVQLGPDGDASGGVGLGLAIVDRLVQRNGGRLELMESPWGGCRARTTWLRRRTPLRIGPS